MTRLSLGARRTAARIRAERIECAKGVACVGASLAALLALPLYCLHAAYADHGLAFALATVFGVR